MRDPLHSPWRAVPCALAHLVNAFGERAPLHVFGKPSDVEMTGYWKWCGLPISGSAKFFYLWLGAHLLPHRPPSHPNYSCPSYEIIRVDLVDCCGPRGSSFILSQRPQGHNNNHFWIIYQQGKHPIKSTLSLKAYFYRAKKVWQKTWSSQLMYYDFGGYALLFVPLLLPQQSSPYHDQSQVHLLLKQWAQHRQPQKPSCISHCQMPWQPRIATGDSPITNIETLRKSQSTCTSYIKFNTSKLAEIWARGQHFDKHLNFTRIFPSSDVNLPHSDTTFAKNRP